MLLKPKNTKFKKVQKGGLLWSYPLKRLKKQTNSYVGSNQVTEANSTYCLVALEPSRITAAQIAAVILAIKSTRRINKDSLSRFWIRIFPHEPVTKKPAEVRMGKGKGNVDHWIARIQEGSILLELRSPNHNLALTILKVASSKLPVKTMIGRRRLSL